MTDYDIGRLTSPELVEVRTVLSRAETALDVLRDHPYTDQLLHLEDCRFQILNQQGELWDYDRDRGGHAVYDHSPCATVPHPDIAEMRDALQTTVNVLRKWERTGPKKRSK